MVYDPIAVPEGPTVDDLAAIEAEWPLIEAELALLDAEIRMTAGQVSELDWRRLRRAQQRVTRQMTAYLTSAAPDGDAGRSAALVGWAA